MAKMLLVALLTFAATPALADPQYGPNPMGFCPYDEGGKRYEDVRLVCFRLHDPMRCQCARMASDIIEPGTPGQNDRPAVADDLLNSSRQWTTIGASPELGLGPKLLQSLEQRNLDAILPGN